MVLKLESPAFSPGGDIPRQYTCDGPDLSPPLRWSDPPAGTQSLALICDDPDAPAGTWVHWVLYRILPSARELPEGIPKQEELADGSRQGRNDFRKIGYGGPCPPRGPKHRYYFRLYALDIVPDLPAGATKAQLLQAMDGHILAQGELMGRYGR
ncbi:MAG: YbhB/YbcL family Raf kinase inhibitor-like protein [Anaerolineae bacterium]|nr:YbhB/YbcL family Raf kinase inhibitor-like protein [Anaerolineae bacterium]